MSITGSKISGSVVQTSSGGLPPTCTDGTTGTGVIARGHSPGVAGQFGTACGAGRLTKLVMKTVLALGAAASVLAPGMAVAQPGPVPAEPFPPVPFYLQVNSPARPIGNGDWYSAPRAVGGGGGANFLQVHVPLGWPSDKNFVVDLLSPDMNSSANYATGPGPRDENDMTPTTNFRLYAPGATYDVINPDLPVVGTELANRYFIPNSVPHGTWHRLITLPAPVAPGAYVMRTTTDNGTQVPAVGGQNGFRVRVGHDDGSAVVNDLDGIPNSGDEAFVSTPGQTLEQAATGSGGITFFRYVPPGQTSTLFHNFDMDGNVAIRYYAPGEAIDPAALTGGVAGTVSADSRWNGTPPPTAASQRRGDNVATPTSGYWGIRVVVNQSNQFNLETEPGQPMFTVLPPQPKLQVEKVVSVAPAHNPALPGDTVTYKITITNISDPTDGGGDAYEVVVADPTPAGFTAGPVVTAAGFTPSTTTTGTEFAITPGTKIAPTESREFFVTYSINGSAPGPVTTNTVSVAYQNSIQDPFLSTDSVGINVNTPPVADSFTVYTNEDTTITISLSGHVSDPEGDVVTLTNVSTPTNGVAGIVGGQPVYTPNPDWHGTDSFIYTVSDGTLTSTGTITVVVAPVNDPPVAADFSVTTPEDTATTINVLAHATDPDGDVLTLLSVGGAINGTVTIVGGQAVFTPAQDFHGAASFTYTVSDGFLTDTATVTVTVTPVNDPPVANSFAVTTNEDTPLTIDVLAHTSDVDGDTVVLSSFTQPANGTVVLSGNDVLYTPNADWYGTDTFTYTVSDGNGGTATGTVTITVNPVNDPPVANDFGVTTDEDTTVTIDVIANSSDVEGDPLTVVSAGPAGNGTVTIVGNQVVYVPNPNFYGTDTFTYTVDDGNGGTATGTVTVTVNPINDPPVAHDDFYVTGKNSVLHIDTIVGVIANDADVDNTSTSLVVLLETPAAFGTIDLHADGSFNYTPAPDFVGTDSFQYRVQDPSGAFSIGTVYITVGPLPNSPPVANNDAVITNENQSMGGYVLGNDTDVDGDPLTAQVITYPLHGSLTMNPDGTFIYTPTPFYSGPDSFTYQAYDPYSMSNIATVFITVNPVNNAPVVNGESYTINEDTMLTINAPGLLANDYDPDGDTLQVAVDTNPANGTLVINGDGSFVYTPNQDFNGTDSFTYAVTDGNGGITIGTVVITVNAVNDAPKAVNDNYSTAEGIALPVPAPGVLGNDTDAEGDPLTATLVSAPTNGWLTFNADGSFVYNPNPYFHGTDTFSYRTYDGQAYSAPATVTITVTPVNDAPVANPDYYAAQEGTPLTINAANGVLANDTDPDGDVLAITVTTFPAHGSLTYGADGSFVYTPNPLFSGTDTFVYEVRDPSGAADTAIVTLSVGAVNNAPVAYDDNYGASEGDIVTGNVLANDTDPDGDTLTAQLKTGPTVGSLIFNSNGTFVYTPLPNWNGTVTFTYQALDGTAMSNIATVTIVIQAVNDDPVANDDFYTVNEDTVLNVSAPGVLLNDTDADGDTLSVTIGLQPLHGTVYLNSNGSFVYTPNANYHGTDFFTYHVSDGHGGTDTAAVNITVLSVNDKPVAAPDAFIVNQDTLLTVPAPGVLDNDTDADGDALTAIVVTPPTNGTLVMNPDGSFTYQPDAGYSGTDSFRYKANDGTEDSAPVTVTITVVNVNDAPVAVDDHFYTNEDQVLVVSAPGILSNDSDPDGDALSAILVNNPQHGTVTLNANGSFTYTPDANWNGTDSFAYKVSDGQLESNIATARITVRPIDDDPVAVPDAYTTDEDTTLTIAAPGVLGNDYNPDGPVTLYTNVVAPPAHGTLVYLGADGAFQYVPQANYHGTDVFVYRVFNGTSYSDPVAVTLTINPVEDNPVALPNSYAVLQNQTLTVSGPGVLADDYDPDGDPLSAVLGSQNVQHGSLTLNSDGSFTYVPNGTFVGTDTFTYFATDNKGNVSEEVTVTLIVGGVNHAPEARDDNYIVPFEDLPLIRFSPGVMGNDSDPDGDSITAQLILQPQHGLVVLSPGGGFVYTPLPNYNGPDSFTYRVFDGELYSNVATVNLSIQSINDRPVAQPDNFSTPEDTPLTVAAPGILSNDTDADGDTMTAVLVSNPSHGILNLDGNGGFVYTPNADWFGTDTFTYRAVDGNGGVSALTVVTIVVSPVNDAPITNDDTYTTDEDTTLTVVAPGVLQNDTDVDSATLQAILVSSPLNGTVTLNSDGRFVYVPVADFFGTDTFTYRANDGSLDGNVATVFIIVKPVQDAPRPNVDLYHTMEGTTLTISAPGVLANDVDVDGDTLTALLADNVKHGQLTLQTDGSFVYVPTPGYYGADYFLYYAFDGHTQSAATTVTITIGFVNDPPVARDDEYLVFEDTVTTIPAPGVIANDYDPEDDVLSATLVQGPLRGTLVLNADGSFVYTPLPNYTGTDYFLYQVNDGLANSNIAKVVLYVEPINDEPIVNQDYYSTDESKPLHVVAPGVLANDFDADNEPLTSIIRDNPVNGVVVLNGDGSFDYTPNPYFFGEDVFTYTVFDGHMESDYTTVTILVRPVNDRPVANDDVYNAVEDTVLTIAAPGVLANDTDPDDDALTATLVTGAANGIVVLNADGSFTYTPAANFAGLDSFTYQVTDGLLNSAPATVTIRVREVPDAPIAQADEYSTPEDRPIVVATPGILANDYSPDGKALTALLKDNTLNGTLALSGNGGFVYTPNPSFFGTDYFTYVADDGSSQSAVTTVTITVGAVNNAPVANDDVFNVLEATATTIPAPGILANDTDIDDAVLTASLVTGPLYGTLTLNLDGSFTYTPTGLYNGVDTFTYQASDGKTKSNVATVRINVLPVQNGPVANADAYSTNENQPLTIGAPGVLINDYDDDGDSLTAVLVDNASNGSVSLAADGSFVYTPVLGFFGTDFFTYQATDGTSATAVTTVTITVRGVNDAPVAQDDVYNVAEDGVLSVLAPGVLQNDSDIDGDAIVAEQLTQPLYGSVVFNADGSFVYTPNPNYNGTDSFTYRAVDPFGLASAPATVLIQIGAVQDAPVTNADLYSTRENTPIAVPAPGVLANDYDADGDTLVALPVALPQNGTLIFPGDGSFIYTPDTGWHGVDTFYYIANDGTTNSAVTTVTINVGPVNDAPIANNDVYNVFEDTVTTVPAPGVLANDTDADDDALTATLINGPLFGTIELRPDGSFTYTPFENYYGPDSFTYQVTDGLANSNVATVTLNVLPVADEPIANPDYFVVDEGQQLIVANPGILGNDFDADDQPLTAILQAEPAHGQILLGAGGGFIYTPDPYYHGQDEFTYMANDGTMNSPVTTVTITVRPRNDRPEAADDVYEVDEDTTLTIAAPGVLVNDRDADGDPLTATLETLPLNGVVTLNADGSFTYVPRANFYGTDSFTYRAYDGTEESGVGLVTINVRPVNDVPVANDDNFFTQEDTQLVVAAPGVLVDDIDADGDALSAVLVNNVSNGTLLLNADGSFVYTPNLDFSGTDTFTYRATDGKGVSNVATVTITVGVVNDVPVANPDSYRLFEDTVFTVPAPGVLANDFDGDGDVLDAQLVQGPLYGTLVLNGNGGFTYTPMADYTGTDWFTYQATDGLSDSNITTVTLTVVAQQDQPLANPDFYSTTENQALVVARPGLLGNDVDADGETLIAILQTNPLNGTVALNGDGSFVYTPNSGWFGTDFFTYRANDGHENSDPTTVTITVSPVNDAPVAVDDIYETDEDEALIVDDLNGVLANDLDLDGDILQAVLVNQPLNGSVVLNANGSFTYTPRADWNGTDSFTYRAYDGQDWSNVARVVITVRPVQDKPVGRDDMYSVPEDKVLIVQAPGVLGNDSDADGDTLTAILVDAPQFGVITLQANGGFIYTPDPDFAGIDTFTYFANDGTENSDLVTVTISVGSRNDETVAVDDLYYVDEDTTLSVSAPGILGNDYDVDGDVLSAVLITPPLHGTLVLQPSGAFVYTPNVNFSGEDRFIYRASDGTSLSKPATVRLIVTEVNDLPVLSNVVVTPNVYEGQTAVLTADLYDADFSDTFLVTVNWGDGTAPTIQAYPAGTSKIFLTHLYADDNPTETPVDVNQVSITVQDNRGGAASAIRPVTVTNLPPELTNVTLTQVIPTGGTARLQGQIKDAGVQDTFALGIWWGDGTAEVHQFGPGGLHNFDYIHTYATPGFYTVTVGVMDDDTGIAVQTPSINVRNTADLILTKTANPDPASVGELLTYTMIVTNNGPDLARNVILMDTIPSNVDVISANPPMVQADGVLNWFLGDMPAGQTYRIDLVVKTRQQGPIHNIAKVISDELDPVEANNVASVTTTIGWLPDGPDLQVQDVTLDSRCRMTKFGVACTMEVWALIANRGNRPANASVYSAYLSVDNQLSSDDIKLFTKRIAKMKPLQVKPRRYKYKAPYGMTSTGKFLILVVDEGNLVFEANETNNVTVIGPLP